MGLTCGCRRPRRCFHIGNHLRHDSVPPAHCCSLLANSSGKIFSHRGVRAWDDVYGFLPSLTCAAAALHRWPLRPRRQHRFAHDDGYQPEPIFLYSPLTSYWLTTIASAAFYGCG
ncbi:hypothetical protein KCP69_12940 [Salmonella enterica subsp. enterica]|nr:hypothetical protein KCP69_12940 [Salmonella enterica subsp. enterica]